MIIKNFKRKMITTSISLIIIGLIISVVGFSIGGFSLNDFKSNDTDKWYKTINIDGNSFSIGF